MMPKSSRYFVRVLLLSAAGAALLAMLAPERVNDFETLTVAI